MDDCPHLRGFALPEVQSDPAGKAKDHCLPLSRNPATDTKLKAGRRPGSHTLLLVTLWAQEGNQHLLAAFKYNFSNCESIRLL